MRPMKALLRTLHFCLIATAIALAGTVAGQEPKSSSEAPVVQQVKSADSGQSSSSILRSRVPVQNADLNGSRGDVVLDSNGGYATLEGGVIFKPKSNYPWMVGLVGSSSGGFTIVNTGSKQLFKLQDNGTLEVLGPSSTSGLLIRDSNAVGMGTGGVEVKVSGNSALISGSVQVGVYGTAMINTLTTQPLALNAWSPADVTVGYGGDTAHGLRVYSSGPSIVSGRLGIGTPNPAYMLDVAGSSNLNGNTSITGTAAITGNATITGTLAAGATTMNGNGTVTGTLTAGAAAVNGNANITGMLAAGATTINGNGTVTGTLTAGATTINGNANISGVLTAGSYQAKYQDVAEWVPATGKLTAGTLVVLDAATPNTVTASTRPYDTTVAGVVSPRPGLVLGEAGDAKALVATTGRVRVHVDASEHPIAIGDLLVSSPKPGMAMKSMPVDIGGISIHRPGTVIGKALEPLQGGEGEILVLLSLQ